MYSIEDAKTLLARAKYIDAGKVLDYLLAKDKDNDELWYLRGIVSLKLKNYTGAQESLIRAAFIKKKPDYFKLKGICHLQIYEIEEAVEEFEKAMKLDRKDSSLYFFLSICYMFLNDPRSREMIQNAYLLDKKKTKELVKNFYEVFFKNDLEVDKKRKEEIEKEIEKID